MHKMKQNVGYRGKRDCLKGRTGLTLAYRAGTDEYEVEFPGVRGLQLVPTEDLIFPEVALLPTTLAQAVGLPEKPALPTDSAERKRWPLFSGLLRYFPASLARVSHHSYLGNEKHNPGQRLNHARGKSGDHEDCIVRHLVDASEHPAGSAARLEELSALAWRALALLQEECELAGHRPAPGATFDKEHNGI